MGYVQLPGAVGPSICPGRSASVGGTVSTHILLTEEEGPPVLLKGQLRHTIVQEDYALPQQVAENVVK